MEYRGLLDGIGYVSNSTQMAVARSINQTLTLRNWLIGAYIIEFEQNGDDRANYGDALIRRLAKDLAAQGYSGLSRSNLVSFRKFAFVYAALAKNQTLSGLFTALAEGVNFAFGASDEKSQTLSGFSEVSTGSPDQATQSLSLPAFRFPSLEARADSTESFAWKNDDYYLKLFRVVSWSNLMELCRIDDPLKRTFYELECVKSAWSNRELKRQMNSLLFERVGLSRDASGSQGGCGNSGYVERSSSRSHLDRGYRAMRRDADRLQDILDAIVAILGFAKNMTQPLSFLDSLSEQATLL
ncbi:DUF1016 N-terminal domain-containing protein [Leptolyngbya sp. AN03gr2]|uniref:DUF1016 N-terminal domain-containing protein n=1 Tax=unclassified Leptolyngbya TaxID=2650499 RepID=UPI003D32068F